MVFFFSSRRRHTRSDRDWSSDVCSSDLSIEKINHIICVASGKGGVGKSTTAVNLALALSKLGRSVGILDADIYGPSLPLMMGVPEGTRPQLNDNKFMLPFKAPGIACNSMGFFVD